MKDKNKAKSKQNAKYKDSVFVDLFAKCPEAKENFLSLYNSLHGTSLTLAETKIEPIILEQTVYTGRYNDVSMLLNEKIIVLVEQQSTINENMPFRFLEYVSRLYEKLVPLEKRYEHRLIKLPKQEFYVFYNGEQDYDAENTLKLSDAFRTENSSDEKPSGFTLELTAKVFNINKWNEISAVLRCAVLSGYATLTKYAREARLSGREDYLDYAVMRCISEGTLAEYLKRNSTEVRNMLISEYDYDTDIRVQRKESYEIGAEEKAIETAHNFLEMGISPEKVSKGTGIPLEKVLKLKEQTHSNFS